MSNEVFILFCNFVSSVTLHHMDLVSHAMVYYITLPVIILLFSLWHYTFSYCITTWCFLLHHHYWNLSPHYLFPTGKLPWPVHPNLLCRLLVLAGKEGGLQLPQQPEHSGWTMSSPLRLFHSLFLYRSTVSTYHNIKAQKCISIQHTQPASTKYCKKTSRHITEHFPSVKKSPIFNLFACFSPSYLPWTRTLKERAWPLSSHHIWKEVVMYRTVHLTFRHKTFSHKQLT